MVAPQLEVFGGYTSVSGDSDFGALNAGVRYKVASGLYGELGMTSIDKLDTNIISFEIGYDFGKGATFDQRNWVSKFHGL